MNMIHSEYSSSDASGTMTEDYSNYDGGDYQVTTSTQATSTGRVETTTDQQRQHQQQKRQRQLHSLRIIIRQRNNNIVQ